MRCNVKEIFPGNGISFYASPDGSDSNDGTEDMPFKSLRKAKEAVRTVIAGGMAADVHVYLRGGTYYQDATLTLNEQDSGRDGCKVIYTNYPGEIPRIVGGRRVTGWKPEKAGSGIYKVHMDELLNSTWDVRQLFENGVRAVAARHPNHGYLKVGGALNSATQFTYASGDLEAAWDYAQAQIYIWGQYDWFSSILPVAAVDHAGRMIAVKYGPLGGAARITADNRYFIQNVRGALDQPGEFFIDKVNGDVYYMKRSGDPIDSLEIVIPTVNNVIELKGSTPDCKVSHIEICGLHFMGSNFSNAVRDKETFIEINGDWNRPAEENRRGIIYFENARDNIVRNCVIQGAGYNGVMLNYDSQHNTIYGNHIFDAGYHGVLMSGTNVGVLDARKQQIYDNKYNTLSNNHIHNVGRQVGHGAGIFLYQSGDNEISHNLIHDSPRYGIGMKGFRYMSMPSSYGDVAVTWDNHWDFITSRNNRFQYNEMYRTGQDSEDCGMISFWGTGTRNVVDSNKLHHSQRGWGYNFAIYLDDATDYVMLRNNLIYKIDGSQQQYDYKHKRVAAVFAKGVYNTLCNNIIAMDWDGMKAIETYTMVGERTDHHTYFRNILFGKLGAEYIAMDHRAWSDDRVTDSENNLFFGSGTEMSVRGIPGEQTLEHWRRLFENKFDQSSKTDDPHFVDPENDDYRLQPDSPAYSLGFEEIDIGKMGLKGDYIYTVDEVLDKVYIGNQEVKQGKVDVPIVGDNFD